MAEKSRLEEYASLRVRAGDLMKEQTQTQKTTIERLRLNSQEKTTKPKQ
ncbi:MAG: hypothetical protein M1594_00055 [Candidatus Marsarchaeota archaeon]|nr:hypothetical protein [Candidatus Marsarchaeota archaeon]